MYSTHREGGQGKGCNKSKVSECSRHENRRVARVGVYEHDKRRREGTRPGKADHKHRDEDEKPREVGRHDVEQSKHRHLRIWVLARPNPDCHEEEGDSEKATVKTGDRVYDHDAAPSENEHPEKLRGAAIEVLFKSLGVLNPAAQTQLGQVQISVLWLHYSVMAPWALVSWLHGL